VGEGEAKRKWILNIFVLIIIVLVRRKTLQSKRGEERERGSRAESERASV